MALTGLDQFLRPETLEEALAALGPGAVPVAGGTDLINRRGGDVTTLVDLSRLGLRFVTEEERAFVIGAMATLTDVLEHPVSARRSSGVLAETLLLVGSPLLRNVATVGGHLARARLSDVIPVLLSLDAEVEYFDGGYHTLPLATFYADAMQRRRLLITRVILPPDRPRSAASFRKLSRTAFDLALINAACRVSLDADGIMSEARIVIGETPRLGASVPEAEAALVGQPLDDQAISDTAGAAAAHTPVGDDQRATAEYRAHLAAVMVRRCLERCRTLLGGGP